MALKEVLSTNIQVPLSELLACVPNLNTNLIAWLENERETPQDEVQCDFIEEGVDHQKIARASWEGDASNVMLPMTYNNFEPIPSIVDGGSCINAISKKLYDVWDLPRMESAPFSLKLVDQRKVKPLGLVKNVHVRVARI